MKKSYLYNEMLDNTKRKHNQREEMTINEGRVTSRFVYYVVYLGDILSCRDDLPLSH